MIDDTEQYATWFIKGQGSMGCSPLYLVERENPMARLLHSPTPLFPPRVYLHRCIYIIGDNLKPLI